MKQNADDMQAVKEEAASLLHDLRTSLLTVKLLLGQRCENEIQRAPIEEELADINRRLDRFWDCVCALEETGEQGKDGKSKSSEPVRKGPTEPTSPENDRPSLKILIIEDDPVHGEILERQLLSIGHDVQRCQTGHEALELCQTSPFQVVFLDYNIPDKSGPDIARALDTSLHIIGMSNDPRTVEMRARCLDAGMRDYLAKPIDMTALKQCLDRYFVQGLHHRDGPVS